MIAPALYKPPTMVLPMSEERYHVLPQVSRSQLVDFLISPSLYYSRHVVKDPVWQKKPTDAMDFGTFCHSAILIEKDATKGFRVIPEDVLSASGAKAGNKWKEWEAANAGVAHFKQHEVGPWLAMWESLQQSGPAHDLLLAVHDGSREEQTVLWEYNGIGLRCRVDRVVPGRAIADLKTTANADLNAIEREIENRQLYIQAAFYQWGWFEATGERLDFVFVFVEKSAPFRTVCVSIDADWIGIGMEKIHGGLRRLQACADADDWSDPISQAVHTLSRPTYASFKYELVESAA